jgi:hypothetical protein
MNNIPTKCQNNSNCRWIKARAEALLLFYGSLLGGWSSRRRVLGLLHAPLGGRRRSGGPGLGELEEAAADLLGVRLEHLNPLLDRGRGLGGGGLGGGREGLGLDGRGGALGLGLRNGAVALGEDAGRRERLHEAAHHGVARALRRRPDAERREQRLRGLGARSSQRGGIGGSLGRSGLAALGGCVGGVLRHSCHLRGESTERKKREKRRDMWRGVRVFGRRAV